MCLTVSAVCFSKPLRRRDTEENEFMLLTRVYDALLTVAYPQVCRVCGGGVEEHRFGVVCKACWDATPVFNGDEAICWKCGALSPGGEFSPAIQISPEVRKAVN